MVNFGSTQLLKKLIKSMVNFGSTQLLKKLIKSMVNFGSTFFKGGKGGFKGGL